MVKKEQRYRRLPGRPIFSFAGKSLWQGADHLLYVESLFFKERYKRFYYKDIQLLLLKRNTIHWAWTFVWGALALVFGIIAIAVSQAPYVSGTLLACCLAALLANLIMGPSCTVYLQTAVQVQKLANLRRVRTAGKVMTVIKTLVEERQGAWEEPQNHEAQGTLFQASPASPPDFSGASVLEKDRESEPKGPYKLLLHQILFGLLIVIGVLGAVQVFLKSLPIGLFEVLLQGAAQIMVIVALVRWFRHLKGTLIAKFNWMALIFIAVQTIIGYGLYMAVSIRNPEINYHHWAMFKMMFETQMSDHPLALAGNIIFAGGSLLLGAFGLLVVQRHGVTLGPSEPATRQKRP
ncbi:MAG: hypothetical protein PVJ84_18955 [Desulfobacteraceae bacterium]|jgi:hypothetical protein